MFGHALLVGDPRLLGNDIRALADRWSVVATREQLRHASFPVMDSFQLDLPNGFDMGAFARQADGVATWLAHASARHGAVERIVAPGECTIELGARLRDRFNIAGWRPDDAASVRDKIKMKRVLRDAGVRTPDFLEIADCCPPSSVRAWADGRPGRIVLKPADQAGSRGVMILDDGNALANAIADLPNDRRSRYLAEDFLDLPLLHIDGVLRGGELRFGAVSRYMRPCLSWLAEGHAMASVLVESVDLQSRGLEFAREVTHALGIEDAVFHLEAFQDDRQLHFLEIAGRPGGAGIAPYLKRTFGVDLHHEMMLSDLCLPPQVRTTGQLDASLATRCGGWVVTPMPTRHACRVEGHEGLEYLPASLVEADLPEVGTPFNLDDDDGLPSGRFYVSTSSEAQAKLDLERIAESYRVVVSDHANAKL